MKPERTSGSASAHPIPCQRPVARRTATNMTNTIVMRVRVKAIAPRCLAGPVEISPVSAQQVAAPSAASS